MDKKHYHYDHLKALVYNFLPYFESNDKKYDISTETSFDPFIYHIQALKFVAALNEANLTIVFDWSAWKTEAQKFFGDPQLIAAADLPTIQKLFTTIIRAERMTAGVYASMIDNGVILALLKRLKDIIDEL